MSADSPGAPLNRPWSWTRSFRDGVTSPYAILLPILALILIVRPVSPDLVAQLARAAASKATENATWWTAWYGGIATRSYSIISPALMGAFGTWTIGALSVVITAVAAGYIAKVEQHSKAVTFFVGIGVLGNLASGRVTFALGLAFGSCALAFLMKRWIVAAIACSILAVLSSALAGFFLGLVLVPWLLEKSKRKSAFVVCVALSAAVVVSSLLFPSGGFDPMPPINMVGGVLTAIVVYFCVDSIYAKRLAVLFGVLSLFFFFVDTPIGSNLLRLPMVLGLAFVLATKAAGRKRQAIAIIAMISWVGGITGYDLFQSRSSSTEASFYAPLLKQLSVEGTQGARVEVVDPATHGPALYVASKVPLARGWERQVDTQLNPLFYDGTLDATNYHQWLGKMAVRWVAVPNTSLDHASRDEGRLVAGNLPYLHLAWKSGDWSLYEVTDAQPLATAPVTSASIHADSISLVSNATGWSDVSVSWTRGLTLDSITGGPAGDVQRDGSSVRVYFPQAGSYNLHVD